MCAKKKPVVFDEEIDTQEPIHYIFKEATRLMFPDLAESDARFERVARYAQWKYRMAGNSCTLCAIPGSKAKAFKEFYELCCDLQIDPGRREVIVHKMGIRYTDDYGIAPKPYSRRAYAEMKEMKQPRTRHRYSTQMFEDFVQQFPSFA